MSCAVSIVAVFMFVEAGADAALPALVDLLSKEWAKGEYVMCVIFPLLVLAFWVGLALPFVALFWRRLLHGKAAALTVAASTLVLVFALIWALSEEYEGPGGRSPETGLSWDSVVFLVLIGEFLVLGFGAIEVISSRRELAKMMESRKLDPALLVLTLGTAAALWVFHAVLEWTRPGALALLMVNLVVVVAVVRIWTRKPEPS